MTLKEAFCLRVFKLAQREGAGSSGAAKRGTIRTNLTRSCSSLELMRVNVASMLVESTAQWRRG